MLPSSPPPTTTATAASGEFGVRQDSLSIIMALASAVALGLFALNGIKHAEASPIQNISNSKPCTSFTIPVPIVAHNHIYDTIHVNNNIDAAAYTVDVDTWDSPTIFERITDNITISKTFDIYATLCVPPNGAKKSYLQIATHGGAFDSRYWDSKLRPEKYSYVDAASAQGYSILTYDRLGCGMSAKPNPYTELQAPAEVEILRGIAEIVRDGKLWNHIPESAAGNYIDISATFEKIILVGHSFGSFISYSLTSLYPHLSDAAVFTGFILSNQITEQRTAEMALQYAPESDPELFGDYGPGYTVVGTPGALQVGFLSARVNKTLGIGGFEPEALDYMFKTRAPTSGVEISSAEVMLASVLTAPEYQGPVQFTLGEYDMQICLGDCKGTYNVTMIENEMYPKAKGVDIYLQPGTGHAMPFHRGAHVGFKRTFDWLSENGL